VALIITKYHSTTVLGRARKEGNGGIVVVGYLVKRGSLVRGTIGRGVSYP